MIIRLTLKTSIYTEILEKYFKDNALFDEKYYTKHEYKKFNEDIKSYDKYKMGTTDKEKLKTNIEKVICSNFTNYINSINANSNWHTKRFNTTMINTYKDFILNNFEFRLVNLILDKNYDKEVVFYIHQIEKYIVL